MSPKCEVVLESGKKVDQGYTQTICLDGHGQGERGVKVDIYMHNMEEWVVNQK